VLNNGETLNDSQLNIMKAKFYTLIQFKDILKEFMIYVNNKQDNLLTSDKIAKVQSPEMIQLT